MASGIQKWLAIIPKPGIEQLSLAPFSKFLDTQTQKADDDDEGNFLSFSGDASIIINILVQIQIN